MNDLRKKRRKGMGIAELADDHHVFSGIAAPISLIPFAY